MDFSSDCFTCPKSFGAVIVLLVPQALAQLQYGDAAASSRRILLTPLDLHLFGIFH